MTEVMAETEIKSEKNFYNLNHTETQMQLLAKTVFTCRFRGQTRRRHHCHIYLPNTVSITMSIIKNQLYNRKAAREALLLTDWPPK